MVQILELFGGIGSPRCALRNLNIPTKAIDYVEIDENAVRSYNAMFAEELEYKTQSVVGWNLKPDILIHGSPCQDMSIAGHQGKATAEAGRINRGKGADKGSGTRSSLMWETIHIIQNMGEWKPKYVIWEMEEKQMAQAMEKGRVIELLEYYKDIDGEVSIYRKIISDLTDQYYNPIGAIQCDGLPKGKNNISRQTENMALNIPDYVSGEIREYEAKVQQLQALKAQILQEVSRLKLKEKRIIFDFYMHNLKWEQVAVRNSYSERQCKNIRDTALETLSQRFEKNQIISQFQRIA